MASCADGAQQNGKATITRMMMHEEMSRFNSRYSVWQQQKINVPYGWVGGWMWVRRKYERITGGQKTKRISHMNSFYQKLTGYEKANTHTRTHTTVMILKNKYIFYRILTPYSNVCCKNKCKFANLVHSQFKFGAESNWDTAFTSVHAGNVVFCHHCHCPVFGDTIHNIYRQFHWNLGIYTIFLVISPTRWN